MKSSVFSPRVLFITIAILLAAISRILPHPFNFTPIAAMALFGGVGFSNKKLAFIIPLLAMVLSDALIGWHNTLLYVYASFALITCIGIYISKNVTTPRIILASLISSLLFFLITNSAVWIEGGFQNGMSGLLITLTAGIPFYNNEFFGSFFFNTIAGDLFYCGILFGSFYFAKAKFPSLA